MLETAIDMDDLMQRRESVAFGEFLENCIQDLR